MNRMTIKDLRDAIKGLPEDALVSVQSDSEGNSESTILCFDIVKIGAEHTFSYAGSNESFTYTDGDQTYGVDLEKDNGKMMLILTPSL